MLNCCINHRNGRMTPSSTDDAPEEDEFYDAEEEVSFSSSDSSSVTRHSAWNQPQGRKEKTKWKLLNTRETLYVPITQVHFRTCP